jgi:hypothetical protein
VGCKWRAPAGPTPSDTGVAVARCVSNDKRPERQNCYSLFDSVNGPDGFRSWAGRRVDQPLSEPTMIPAAKCSCRAGYTAMIGIVETMMIAEATPSELRFPREASVVDGIWSSYVSIRC